MPTKHIAGLFILWSVLVILCSGSIHDEDINKNGRSYTDLGMSKHEPEYVAKSEMVQPEDAQRTKGGAGGGPGSIVRQPPSQKGEAAPWNMAPFLNIPMAICSCLWLILVL